MAIKFHLDLPTNISWDQFSNLCVEKFTSLKDKFFEDLSVLQLEILFDSQKNSESKELLHPYVQSVYRKEIDENGLFNFFGDTVVREKSTRRPCIDERVTVIKSVFGEKDLDWLLEYEKQARHDNYHHSILYTILLSEIISRLDEDISIVQLKEMSAIMKLKHIPSMQKKTFDVEKKKLVKNL